MPIAPNESVCSASSPENSHVTPAGSAIVLHDLIDILNHVSLHPAVGLAADDHRGLAVEPVDLRRAAGFFHVGDLAQRDKAARGRHLQIQHLIQLLAVGFLELHPDVSLRPFAPEGGDLGAFDQRADRAADGGDVEAHVGCFAPIHDQQHLRFARLIRDIQIDQPRHLLEPLRQVQPELVQRVRIADGLERDLDGLAHHRVPAGSHAREAATADRQPGHVSHARRAPSPGILPTSGPV